MSRANIFYSAAAVINNRIPKTKYAVVAVSIIFVALLLVNAFLNDQQTDKSICYPTYQTNTITSIILLNIYLSIISIGCMAFCVKQLRFFMVSVLRHDAESEYKMVKLIYKFTCGITGIS